MIDDNDDNRKTIERDLKLGIALLEDDQFEEATTLRIYNIELKAIECLVSGKGPTTYPSPKK